MNKTKKVFQNFLLAIVSLLIFIISAELLTRIFWSPKEKISDVRRGILLDGENRSVIYEGIEYQINSHGIRNKELSVEKNSNEVRILALGDSFIWGDGQSNDQLITIKLSRQLNSLGDQKFEVINAGIGGYNAKNEFEQLLRLYSVYKPDAVIQFFFTNDILATNENNQILDNKVVYHMWLRKNSKFYSFFYYLVKNTINEEMSFPKFILPQDYFDLDDTKTGWVSFKYYTEKIHKFCFENKLKYYFVFIPTLTNLDENYPYLEIKEGVTDFVTNSLKVPFLSFFELFSAYEPVQLWVSEENTHWNDLATTLAADTLAKFLLQHHLIPNTNPTN